VVWGDYLHSAEFDQWAEEHLTSFNKWVKFVHTKIILVDPMTRSPTVITGSANYSDNSTTDNEENSVLVREDGSGAATRVADIYLTEYQRLFMHFVFRSWASRSPTVAGAGPGTGHLIEDDGWSVDYFAAGSWRSRQRQTFAAPL
jgi:phosphatidylserine/phosphatidylglycerophosphate/cardiolipin synthase-like enzyme